MKIVYLANSESVHTQRWARHFSGAGHEVTVISFEPDEIEGVRVIHLPTKFGSRVGILFNQRKVRRLVRDLNPDVVHAHYVTSCGLSGALAGRRPLVVTAWGSDVLVAPEKSWAYRQIVRFVLKRADLITSMADHMTQHLIERQYAAAEKIVTLPFGVDSDVFNPSQRSRRHGDGPPLVISTRQLDHGLDVHLLIRAIPQVLQRQPDARFVVTGYGPLRSQLEQLANDLHIARHVEFRGMLPHDEMPMLFGQADVYVSTSPSDGNNVSINEAMACGAFPVATDIAANRAWVKSGENGLLFRSNSADGLAQSIVEALNQPQWREAVMAQNWEIIRTRASWTRNMARMEKLYASLVAGNGALAITRQP